MGVFFQESTPEIKVTVAENSERHSMTPTYIHKMNLGVNMSYNMRHALDTMFCLLSVSCLDGELFCSHRQDCCANSINFIVATSGLIIWFL